MGYDILDMLYVEFLKIKLTFRPQTVILGYTILKLLILNMYLYLFNIFPIV